MLELVYTSVPKGLLPGSKGFATVAMTTGMPPQIAQTCEALSSYCHVFGLESDKYKNNPVAISYLRVRLGGRVLYAISRTGAAAADYSSRTNKISHHVLLDTNTGDPLPEPGPAALFEALSFRDQWTGEPTYLPERKAPALPNLPRTPPSFHARNWQKAGLSTTLAARLAAAWLANPTRPTFLTFKPDGQPNDYLLGLIDDVIRLLPPESRWNATFSTYLSNELPGTECIGRCVLQNSQGLALAQRVPDTLIIDTTNGQMSGGEYAAATAKELEPAADGLALPPWADPTRRHKEIPQEQSQPGPTGTMEREPLRLRDRSSSEQTIEPPVEPDDTIANKAPTNRLWVAAITATAVLFVVVVTFLCLRQAPQKKEELPAPTHGTNTPSEPLTNQPQLPTQEPPNTTQQTNQATTNITLSTTTNTPNDRSITIPAPTSLPATNIQHTASVSNKTTHVEPIIIRQFVVCDTTTIGISTAEVTQISFLNWTTCDPRGKWKAPKNVSFSGDPSCSLTINDELVANYNPTKNEITVHKTCVLETPTKLYVALVAGQPFEAAGRAEISNRQVVVRIVCERMIHDLVDWLLVKSEGHAIVTHVEGIICPLTPEKNGDNWILRGALPEPQVNPGAKKSEEELGQWTDLHDKLDMTKRKDATFEIAKLSMETYLTLVRGNPEASGTLRSHAEKLEARLSKLKKAKEDADADKNEKGKVKIDYKDLLKRMQDQLVKDFIGEEIGTLMSKDAGDRIERLKVEVGKNTLTKQKGTETMHPEGTIELQIMGKTVVSAKIATTQ